MNDLEMFLHHYLILSPVFLVYLIGLVLAVMRWSRHPRVSLLAFLGISTCLVSGIVVMPIHYWLFSYSWMQDLSHEELERAWLIAGIVDSLVIAVGWGLVLAAIFGWRNEPTRMAADDRPEAREG